MQLKLFNTFVPATSVMSHEQKQKEPVPFLLKAGLTLGITIGGFVLASFLFQKYRAKQTTHPTASAKTYAMSSYVNSDEVEHTAKMMLSVKPDLIELYRVVKNILDKHQQKWCVPVCGCR